MGISQKEYAESEAEAGMLQMDSHIHIMTMYIKQQHRERNKSITKQTKQGNCVPSKIETR